MSNRTSVFESYVNMPRRDPNRLRFTPGFNYDLIPEIVEEMDEEYISKLTKKQRFEVRKIQREMEKKKQAEEKEEQLRLDKEEKLRKKEEALAKKEMNNEKNRKLEDLMFAMRLENEKPKLEVNNNVVENNFRLSLQMYFSREYRNLKSGKISNFILSLKGKRLDRMFNLLVLNEEQITGVLLDFGFSFKTRFETVAVLNELLGDEKVELRSVSNLLSNMSLDFSEVENDETVLRARWDWFRKKGSLKEQILATLAFYILHPKTDTSYRSLLVDEENAFTSELLFCSTIGLVEFIVAVLSLRTFLIDNSIAWREVPLTEIVKFIESEAARSFKVRPLIPDDMKDEFEKVSQELFAKCPLANLTKET